MNLLKSFEAVEELVFEVASWVIFIPKTLCKAIFHPGWVARYVVSEAQKKPEERHQEYMSPILFWLIVGVLPYALILQYRSSGSTAADEVMSTTLPNAAGMLALGPLALVVLPALLRKQPVDRAWLRQLFEAECLAFTPVLVSGVPFLLAQLHGVAEDSLLEFVSVAPFVIFGLIPFSFAQDAILKEELGMTDGRIRVVSSVATAAVMLVACILVVLLTG
jgi:hypothetical protein